MRMCGWSGMRRHHHPGPEERCRRLAESSRSVSISGSVVGRVGSPRGDPARGGPFQEVIMIFRSFPSFAALVLAIVPLAAQEMPKPQAEHQKLARSVGTWDATIEGVGMDGKLHRSKG